MRSSTRRIAKALDGAATGASSADSHAMSYTRFKLALTEDWPTIKPYNEAAWAELATASFRLTTPLRCSRRCMDAGWRCWNR